MVQKPAIISGSFIVSQHVAKMATETNIAFTVLKCIYSQWVFLSGVLILFDMNTYFETIHELLTSIVYSLSSWILLLCNYSLYRIKYVFTFYTVFHVVACM